MSEIKIPKPSKKIFILNWLIYVCPVAGFVLQIALNWDLEGHYIFSILLAPSMICFYLLTFLIPLIVYNVFLSMIRKYDGSEENLVKTNKIANLFPTVSIVMPILFGLIVPFSVLHTVNNLNLHISAAMVFTGSLGSVFLFALLFYILFLHEYEPYLEWLPLKKEFLSLSLIQRNMLVTLFSILGTVLSTISSLFRPMPDMTLTVFFFRYMITTSIIGIICGLLDTYLLIKGISTRVHDINKLATSLSDKNYTVENLPIVSRDEVGVLSLQLNTFYNTTKNLLSEFASSTKQSEHVAKELAVQMSNSENSVSTIVDNVSSIKNLVIDQSAGVEETHATVIQIQKGLQDLNSSIESQAASVTESSAAVEQMVANIRSVTSILNKNSEAVDNLGKASDLGQNKVQEAVESSKQILEESAGLLEASNVIQNIASQTNLLAMNAAIEAAHAGEAGKGFAVVADEIRKLAEESNEQGKTITGRLKNLETSITAIANNTQEVEDQFRVIFDLTKTVNNQENVIKSAMDEQSSGSEQVLIAMHSINDITDSVRNGANLMLKGSEEVASEMGLLAKGTEKITESITEIGDNSKLISQAVDKANETSKKNSETVEGISQLIGTFEL